MSLKSGSYAFTSTGDFALTSANFVEDVEDRVDVEDVEEGVGMKGVYAAVSSLRGDLDSIRFISSFEPRLVWKGRSRLSR